MLKTMQKGAHLGESQQSQQSEAHTTYSFLLNGQKSKRRSCTKDKFSPLLLHDQLFLKLPETIGPAFISALFPSRMFSFVLSTLLFK